MKYTVDGKMRIKGVEQKFSKELEAQSEARAREIILQQLGADHRLKRTQIEIVSVKEAPK